MEPYDDKRWLIHRRCFLSLPILSLFALELIYHVVHQPIYMESTFNVLQQNDMVY